MNMLLEGFKKFVGNDAGLDWELIYKKALWVVEGHVISHSYKSDKNPRSNICLYILFRVVVSSTSNSNSYNSLLAFYNNIQQSFGSNEENEDKYIIYWINRFSDSFGSSEAYNS